MFIPEVGDRFHLYTEEYGLLQGTVFVCTHVDGEVVVAGYAGGTFPSVPVPCTFERKKCSFWPVQPGYLEKLLGQIYFPIDNRVKADAEFRERFRNIIERVSSR